MNESERMSHPMSLIVYGDFGCPACYLAARRVDALHAAGLHVDWRAVEHEPRLPVGGRPLDADAQSELGAQLSELEHLLLPGESLPWAAQRFVPKSEAAVSAYAEAYGAGVADDVRRLLFELYWRDGADIGSPAVLRTPLAGPFLRSRTDAMPLRESGYAVSVDRGPITRSALVRIRTWRADWRELGCPQLPIVLTGGATLMGIDAVRRLGKEIGYVEASPAPEFDDPRRYPAISDRPHAGWVSSIGGRWRFSYRG